MLLFFSTLFAQPQAKRKKPAQPHGPRICFTTEVQDAGNIPEGPDYRFVFPFQNCGDEPLVIERVISPSWIGPEWTKDAVMPGKWGAITLSYITQGRQAPFPFKRTIWVSCNDTASLLKGKDKFELFITGKIGPADTSKR